MGRQAVDQRSYVRKVGPQLLVRRFDEGTADERKAAQRLPVAAYVSKDFLKNLVDAEAGVHS